MIETSQDMFNAAVLFFDDTGPNGPLLSSGNGINRFKSVEELLAFLSHSKQPSTRRLVAVQIPDSNKSSISDISHALSAALGMPESVLHSHMHPGNNPFRFSSQFSNPILPTESGLHFSKTGSVALPYYELRQFQPERRVLDEFAKTCKNPLTNEYELMCSKTRRQIQIHETADREDGPLMVVPRKASFWWNEKPEGGWDAMVICDPVFQHVCSLGFEHASMRMEPNYPVEGGYNEFIPSEKRIDSKPCRTSLFDDLLFYMQFYPDMFNDTSHPHCSVFLLAKIIAGNYSTVLGFLRFQISSMGSRGWSIGQQNKASVREFQYVKRDWLRFRCIPIRQDLEEVFDALGIARDMPGQCADWRDWKHDMQWLRVQLADCSEKYQGLTGDISTLSSMITSNQAAEEAKQSSILTSVALVFAPMTLVSNILAMSGSFQPGENLFGYYFVISIPLTMLVFLVVLIVQSRHAHDEASSMKKFGNLFSVRERQLNHELNQDMNIGSLEKQARY